MVEFEVTGESVFRTPVTIKLGKTGELFIPRGFDSKTGVLTVDWRQPDGSLKTVEHRGPWLEWQAEGAPAIVLHSDGSASIEDPEGGLAEDV